jgi:hypothetical protein
MTGAPWQIPISHLWLAFWLNNSECAAKVLFVTLSFSHDSNPAFSAFSAPLRY